MIQNALDVQRVTQKQYWCFLQVPGTKSLHSAFLKEKIILKKNSWYFVESKISSNFF
jgi:hypothetical protein